jgi:dethiobiotin synthetase
VARSELGTLNHTLLSLEALRARHLEPRALFLVGEPHASNRKTLDRIAHVPYIFEVPPFTPLDRSALEAWCQDHDLEALFRP